MVAEADGQASEAVELYAESARRWRAFGHPLELAHALAGRARCLKTIGNDAQAEPHAAEAVLLFRGLGVDERVLAATGWPPDGRAGVLITP
jgi:hypothetical protein